MLRTFNCRAAHHVILILVSAAMTLPNLGVPSLWDVDEGANAEAAREMFESGNYVVPHFNFQLRDAKPALLYWCQAAAYRVFGVNEFAARFPSAVGGLIAVLLVYELARRMFDATTGFLAGIATSTTFLVCAIARFANPDAILLACTCLTFLVFFAGFTPLKPAQPPRRFWFVPFGIACGLGMLAKGPIAVVLPCLTIAVFLVWQRQLLALWDRRILLGAGAFMLVALPWYAIVTIETRGAFAKGFFLTNNVNRFVAPMEDHGGGLWYHPVVLLAGFAPWSAFLLPALWYAARGCRKPLHADRYLTDFEIRRPEATRLLVCWVVVYLMFFSVSATKLPNYTLPLYPALAILTADFLARWQRREIQPPAWAIGYCLSWMLIIGLVIGIGFPIAARRLAGLEQWGWLGLIPVAGCAAFAAFAVKGRRTGALVSLSAGAAAMVGTVMALAAPGVDRFKAPRALVAEAGSLRRDRDIRLASYQYTQPSLVFYNQREVRQLLTERQVREFLSFPIPSYLFIPEPKWRELQQSGSIEGEVVARRFDLYRNGDVLVISNRPLQVAVQRR
jgi:4-amino-4-deoxy-L-arabinose transferase-like glycosyltransferase